MIYKIWRQAHMWLAAFSSLFLLLAATTGLILALAGAREHLDSGAIPEGLSRPLSEVVGRLSERYGELTSLEVRPSGAVVLETFDEQGEAVRLVVDPTTGEALGEAREQSSFVREVTSLHRSLFLHDLGRVFVGGFTFLFLLILLTGLVLLGRQLGFRRLLSPLGALPLSSRWHLELGRWIFVPLVVVAATGCYSFMLRMGVIPQGESRLEVYEAPPGGQGEMLPLAQLPPLEALRLGDVSRLDFPLMEDEPYILHLSHERLSISATEGTVLERETYPFSAISQRVALDWHTGRTSLWWSIALVLVSLTILVLVVSGFVMLTRRLRGNRRAPSQGGETQADILLLVGSEHGTTWDIARSVASQWQAGRARVILLGLNEYSSAYSAEHLVVFTCTYGAGEAPSGAQDFERLLASDPVRSSMTFSVLAFGSRRYAAYCAYGTSVDQWLGEQPTLGRLLPLCCVDNRSAEDLAQWATQWNAATRYPLSTSQESYHYKRLKSAPSPR